MNQKSFHEFVATARVAAGIVLLCASAAQAVSVSPTYQIFTLKAGDSTEAEFNLQHSVSDEDEDIVLKTGTKEWATSEQNKKIKVDDWLIVPRKELILKKGQTTNFKFEVKAPKKAKGEVVGMVTFEDDSGPMIKKQISIAIFCAIEGTEKIKADLESFTVSMDTGAVSAGVLVRNTGNVHVRPEGSMDIFDANDFRVGSMSFNRGRPTYPEQNREYYGSIKGMSLAPGKYSARITIFDVDREVELFKVNRKFEVMADKTVKVDK